MIAPQRGFEIAEFTSRCAKAQLAMALMILARCY